MTITENRLSPEQIRHQIAALLKHAESLSARDLDAELGRAMLAGADIHELEAEHAEIEAKRRRLRVTIQQLETDLPTAERAAAEATVSAVLTEAASLRPKAKKAAMSAAKAWSALSGALDELTKINAAGAALDAKVTHAARLAGLDTFPRVPHFSTVDLQHLAERMYSTSHVMLNTNAATLRPVELLDIAGEVKS